MSLKWKEDGPMIVMCVCVVITALTGSLTIYLSGKCETRKCVAGLEPRWFKEAGCICVEVPR